MSENTCNNCWHRQLFTFREGKYSEVHVTIYKCLAIPNHPVVFAKRTIRGRLIALKRAPVDCPNHKPYPWLTSEIFKKWREQGVKLNWPFPHIIPDNWWERRW